MKKNSGIGIFTADLRKNRTKWCMLLPSITVIILMCYIPMTGIILAFKEYNYHDGIFGSPFVGFSNFKFFFLSGKAFTVTRNTIAYNTVFLFVNMILQITCAVFLAELPGKWFKKVTQSITLLPYFISWIVVGAFIYNLFNYEFGSVNTFLKYMDLEPINVYPSVKAWAIILICVSAFKNVGYGAVLYLASIVGIDAAIYEAAEIDGANRFQRIFHITLPSIKPTVIILLLLSVGTILKGDFQMYWQVVGNNPMVQSGTDVIDTFVTRSLMQTQEFGMTAAAGLYQAVLSFLLILLTNSLVKRAEPDYSLF